MIGATLYTLQEKLLFRPTVLPQDHAFEFSYPFEELFLKSEDGAVINAVHFKVDNPKGVILYYHGNAGDLQRWGKITEYLVAKNYDVLVMDYRTYGKSTGKLSEQALYDDAQYCYDYLKEQYSEGDITIYGRSFGTGLSTYVASRNNPKQVILETPYYSIADVAKHRFPIFPVKRILKYRLSSYQYISKVTCPITIFHGTDDHIVPFSSGEKLFEAAPSHLSTFITVNNGGHNDLVDFEVYRNGVESIL